MHAAGAGCYRRHAMCSASARTARCLAWVAVQPESQAAGCFVALKPARCFRRRPGCCCWVCAQGATVLNHVTWSPLAQFSHQPTVSGPPSVVAYSELEEDTGRRVLAAGTGSMSRIGSSRLLPRSRPGSRPGSRNGSPVKAGPDASQVRGAAVCVRCRLEVGRNSCGLSLLCV